MRTHDDRQDRRPFRAGITLLEILIAVGIIALLAGLLVPALAVVRASVMKTSCAASQRQFMLAVLAYPGENRGLLPPLNYLNINKSGDDPGANYFLSFFDKDASITSGSNTVKGVNSFYAFGNLALRCPSWYKEWWRPSATAMGFYTEFSSLSGNALRNSQAATQFGFNGEFLDQTPSTRKAKSANLTGSLALIFCGNSHCNLSSNANTRGQGTAWDFPVFPHRARTTTAYGIVNSGGPTPTKPITGPIDGMTNIGWGDGHIESRRAYRDASLAMSCPGMVPLCTTAAPAGPTTSGTDWGLFWYGW